MTYIKQILLVLFWFGNVISYFNRRS